MSVVSVVSVLAWSSTVNAALIALLGTVLGLIIGTVSGFLGGWLSRRAAREADDRRHEHERRLHEERLEREREVERLVARGVARVMQEELKTGAAAMASTLKLGFWSDPGDFAISATSDDLKLLASHLTDEWGFLAFAMRELRWAAAQAGEGEAHHRLDDMERLQLDLAQSIVDDAANDLIPVAQSELSHQLQKRMDEIDAARYEAGAG